MKLLCLGSPELGPVFCKARKQERVTVTGMWRNTAAPAVWITLLRDRACFTKSRGTNNWKCSSMWLCMSSRNFVLLFYLWYFALTAHSLRLLLSRPVSTTHCNKKKMLFISRNFQNSVSEVMYEQWITLVSCCVCRERCVGERNNSSSFTSASSNLDLWRSTLGICLKLKFGNSGEIPVESVADYNGCTMVCAEYSDKKWLANASR